MTKRLTAALLVLAMLGGCSGMSRQEQRALSGGAIGAAGGAVIGVLTGGIVTGALTIITTGCYVIGSIVAARTTARVGLDRMILLGCGLASLGAALMTVLTVAAPPSAVGLVGPMMLFSFGMGLTLAITATREA